MFPHQLDWIDLEKIIKIAQSKKIEIILAGMLAPKSYGTKYKKNFDQIYLNLSKKYDLKLIPFLLEGIAFNPDLNLSDEDIQKLSNKGIKNKDDLAELAVDELQEIIEISSDDASKMIMKAREHWFN